MMFIENKFDFGQTVYLKTDTDQLPRVVTQMSINPNGSISYQLSQGAAASWHWDFEISEEKNVIVSTCND